MDQEIIMPGQDQNNNTEESATDVAVIGEGSGQKVSMQVLQSVFHEITGKSEDISKQYTGSFCPEFSDFQELHLKVSQMLEQYNVTASNLLIKVYFEEDTKQTFETFNEFATRSQASSSPVESVIFQYTFMLVLPQARKAQSYRLAIRLISKLTSIRSAQARMEPFPKEILRIFGSTTASVTIDYVDYTVARSFLSTIDDWFKNLHEAEVPTFIKFIRAGRNRLVTLVEYFWIFAALFSALTLTPKFVNSNDNQASTTFLISSLVGIYLCTRLGFWIGRFAEDSARDWQELASIRLNKSDEKELKMTRQRNKHSLVRSSLAVLFSILIGVIGSLIANKLSTG